MLLRRPMRIAKILLISLDGDLLLAMLSMHTLSADCSGLIVRLLITTTTTVTGPYEMVHIMDAPAWAIACLLDFMTVPHKNDAIQIPLTMVSGIIWRGHAIAPTCL